MRRSFAIAVVLASFLAAPTAWAETLLGSVVDPTVTLGTAEDGTTIVTVTGYVDCTTDDPAITEVQITGILRQPKFEPIKLGAGDFEAFFTCDTHMEFDLVFAGDFHPGRAQLQVTTFACDPNACDETKVTISSSVFNVKITK